MIRFINLSKYVRAMFKQPLPSPRIRRAVFKVMYNYWVEPFL